MKRQYITCSGLMTLLGFSLAIGQNARDSVSQVRNIDEVVVTAYGIKKEKKSLGYVYQDIKGTTLVDARENNITNALVGKVSALQVVKSAAGPAASSKIILRGMNSLVGDNQPLIVVDGVPMVNFVGAANNDFWNPSADMGNGLSDLNPEDIENVTVLKGGAASALYGSRAGNGVIMITTKSGKGKKGIGITLSETVGFSDFFVLPELQKTFGQGTNGVSPTEFTSNTSGASWGPKIEGQEVANWNGQKTRLQSYNNLKNFFQTGHTNTHTLTIQNNFGANTTLYTSGSYLTDEGVVPEAKYNRLNLTTRATSKFGTNDRWSTDVKVQFINSIANNRPVGGSNSNNFYSSVLTMPNTINIADFRNGMNEVGAAPYWWVSGSGANPYWFVYNSTNRDIRNRFLMNGQIRYAFNSWLDADVRVGTDTYNTKYENRSYYAGPLTPKPYYYSTGLDRNNETNYIASINAHKDHLIGNWNGAISVFGQIMKSNFNSINSGGTLRVPNYFSVTNFANGSTSTSEYISRKQINSLFSTAEISYDGFWFLNGTARWDWSSTLAPENRRYFYPSVSTSLVITDMLKKMFDQDPGRFISFAKIRAAYAVTGNSLGFNELYNYYLIGQGANGSITAGNNSVLYNPNVVAELLKTFEAGVNVRFFNRVDLDVNYYDTHATSQLINIPLNPFSGYSSFKANAGDIQNTGIEVTLNADVVRNTDFKWNLLTNYSHNTNKILDLYPGINQSVFGGYDTLSFTATVGGYYGTIYGSTYARVNDPNSPFNGRIIVDGSGLPTANSVPSVLGDQAPRSLVGITNSLLYKNWGLSFQVDGRFGGKFYSGTTRAINAAGVGAETVVNGERVNLVVDGVVSDGKGGYVQNTKEVTPQQYWTAVTGRGGNLGINEAFIYSADNIRLRNVQLTYNLPKDYLQGTALQSAKASFSVNNVFMIKSAVKGVDPESVYAIGTNALGFENLTFPTLRSFIFNITLGF